MRGYGVHLLFHLLAAVIGVACGTAGVLWWFGGVPMARWMLSGTILLGVLLLVLQTLYIRTSGSPTSTAGRSRPPQRAPRSRAGVARQATNSSPVHGTRPELEPVDPERDSGSTELLDEYGLPTRRI